jgi:hypothetical protein
MRSFALAPVAWLLLVLTACGDDELSRDVVTSLPPGDATGSETSGTYTLQIATRTCSGSCALTVFGVSWQLCEVGDGNTETVHVIQTDGALSIEEIGKSMYVEQLHGGIDADGRFDVGGYKIQEGSSVGVAVRARGTITADGSFVGDAQAHGSGSYDDQTISCSASYEVTGQRTGAE